MDKLSTIVLRFRDLAVSDTIKEHMDIIKNIDDYCWWGWWNKPQEKLPCDIFAELNGRAKKGGLNIFLFDSGNRKIYLAQCTEIKFSTDTEKIELSEEEQKKIPNYYRTQKYLAWFKFVKIEGVDGFPLDKYSYINVPDFFVDNKNSFSAFNDKKICSLDELYFQQRTIWFIRDFKVGDSEKEINLMSERNVTPENYDEYFSQLDTDSILWLTDLHFSDSHHAYGHSDISEDSLSTLLHDQITNLEIEIPSAIIVSGDLTFTATESEFSNAEGFLRKVNSFYGIDPYKLSVCPGNHDFSFLNTSTNIQPVTDSCSKSYKDFYRNVFNCVPSKHFSSIRRFLTKSLIPIEIISINSVSLQQIQVCEENEKGQKTVLHNFTGLGYVGMDQIREVESELKKTNKSNAVRILVLHHHILPVLEVEEPKIDTSYSMILDAGAVNDFIFRNKISVVLHGHSHKHSYRRIGSEPDSSESFDCNVVGLGSTGASEKDLSEGDPNMFGILSFKEKNLSIKKYRVKKKETADDLICEHIIKF